MYDGCRLGISGRGGAGVLGYLVSAPAGDVGDFSCAEMSPGADPDLAPLLPVRALADCAFRCFRCRSASSECSFILIDRRAGAISSVSCSDLDLRCFPLVARLPPCLVPSASGSDSDDSPDSDEPLEPATLEPAAPLRLPPSNICFSDMAALSWSSMLIFMALPP